MARIVHLNAGTNMRYPTEFTSDIRLVEMEGEAFFQCHERRGQASSTVPASRRKSTRNLFYVKAYQEDELMACQRSDRKSEVDMPESVDNTPSNAKAIQYASSHEKTLVRQNVTTGG